jgi:hypothetical protein
MFSASFPLILPLLRALDVGVDEVTVEATDPDLEILEGDAGSIRGEAATAAERFPLATVMPADTSAVKSNFLATPAKDRPTLSFLQCCANVSFSKSQLVGLSHPISARSSTESLKIFSGEK